MISYSNGLLTPWVNVLVTNAWFSDHRVIMNDRQRLLGVIRPAAYNTHIFNKNVARSQGVKIPLLLIDDSGLFSS
jgi:hypothetical protein